MKKLILILFLVSSCNSAPTLPNQVRRLYSLTFSTCYCQWYNLNGFYNVDNFVPCDDFYAENFPDLPLKSNLEYCNNLVGFSKNAWGKKITPHAKNILQWAKDTCN